MDFTRTTPEELARQLGLYEPLTESVRQLIDATLRTAVGEDDVASAIAHIEAALTTLRGNQIDGTLGISVLPDGEGVPWGNVVIGPRNPVAPPLKVRLDEHGRAVADVELGAAYEGAPGNLHGGYGALILDHVFGHVSSRGVPASVAATGTLTVRYERPTRLGHLHAEAEIEREEGRKLFVAGHLADDDGITVRAEAVMIALHR
jgi:acyl-coenzyme A thioesterase PaaI-like protein